MAQDNVEIVRAMFEPFVGINVSEFDWSAVAMRDAITQVYSEDVELTTLASGVGSGVAAFYRGLDGMARYLSEWTEPFSEYYLENLDYIAVGDCVLVPSRHRGVGAGSGAEVEIELTTLCKLRAGKIRRIEQYSTLQEAREAAERRG